MTKQMYGDFITYDRFKEIVAEEPKQVYKLLFSTIWHLGLRVSEALSLRPMDIDAVKPSDIGVNCDHTIRVWRKRGKFEILPLNPDMALWLLSYAECKKIAPEARIFNRNRTTVYQRLTKYGYTVGGKKKVHPHALRRGFGVWYRANGGALEDLQRIYSHTALAMTLHYVGVDNTRAFNNLAAFYQRVHM